MSSEGAYVYIMSSHSRCLYIGVTTDLAGRVWEHKNGVFEGFTKKYKTHYFVYHETFPDIVSAIAREKQLKGWSRAKKIALMEKMNPGGTTCRLLISARSFDFGSANFSGQRNIPLAFAQDDGAWRAGGTAKGELRPGSTSSWRDSRTGREAEHGAQENQRPLRHGRRIRRRRRDDTIDLIQVGVELDEGGAYLRAVGAVR